jgi:DUF917 family protein
VKQRPGAVERQRVAGTLTLRYGQRITVIALPAPTVFLSPRGLDHAGPGAFGYDLPFRPLFPDFSS